MSSYYGDGSRFAPSWDSLDAAYDDDALDQSEYQYANRDHILFTIDASESMHKPMPDEHNQKGIVRGKSALHQALEAVVNIERSKVITGPSDSVGVLLYNLDPSKVSAGNNTKPGTLVVQALRTINAEEIKRLIKLLETANNQYAEQDDDDQPTVEPPILRETYAPCDSKNEMNVADVLVTCNFLFRDGGTKIAGNKRVFLVTDNDEPAESTTNRAPARTVFGDLSTYGVTVNTFFISRPGHPFDPSLYWNDILDRSDEVQSGAEEGLSELADLIQDLVIKQAPKRKQFTLPLKFGGRDGDIEIGVAGYSLISVQTKGQPKYVRMRGQAVEEVQTKTQYTSAETGADLTAAEITSAYQFGNDTVVKNVLERNWWESEDQRAEQEAYANELLAMDKDHQNGDVAPDAASGVPKTVVRTRVQFSDEQIASFKTMGVDPPQIKILGFQSPDHLRLEENIKHAYFIYPEETLYTGSIRTFTALLKSCLKLKRHALALCRFRSNSPPEFCVLIPQEETFAKDGGQLDPPGFHVVILPFVDDLRDPPKNMTDNLPATDEQSQAMEKLIRRLKFKSDRYISDAYPNPALQYHQQQLQALAFDEDFDTETFDDRALPRYEGIHNAAGHLMLEWKKLIEEDERAVDTPAANTSSKRAIVQLDESDLADVLTAYKNGNIDKLKVAELRDYAKFNKISLTGKSKKADIIEALEPHLATEASKKKAKK